jgi:hypothetical protein
MKTEYKLDAGEQIFFNQELTKTKARTYDIVYPELKARTLIPVSYEAGPGAETVRYEQYDQTGFAKIVSNYASDFPRADIKGAEFASIVKSLGDSYGYNVQEIRAAAMAGKPLQQRRANAAKRAVLQLENTLAFFGDTVHNLGGFLTNPNIPNGTVPADGVGPSTLWSTKTPQQILRDMMICAAAPFINTNGVESANVMLLPPQQFAMVSNLPFSDVSDKTILQWFLSNNQYVKTVDWCNELAAANNPMNADIIFAYNRSPDKVTLEIPSDFEQFAPQEVGLDYVIYCHERFGGVIWYYPMSAAWYDGI